ncbi:hypothetical protein MMC19_002417 [Ptychographa xylographoides]|nr:hypothetical protein [Ptychographa xylographoides]
MPKLFFPATTSPSSPTTEEDVFFQQNHGSKSNRPNSDSSTKQNLTPHSHGHAYAGHIPSAIHAAHAVCPNKRSPQHDKQAQSQSRTNQEPQKQTPFKETRKIHSDRQEQQPPVSPIQQHVEATP